jgi:hypothetical protein
MEQREYVVCKGSMTSCSDGKGDKGTNTKRIGLGRFPAVHVGMWPSRGRIGDQVACQLDAI